MRANNTVSQDMSARTIASKAGVGLVAVIIAAFGVNHLVRVSDGDESHGLLEEKLFGESIGARMIKLTQSENLQRWEEAIRLSEKLVRIVREGKSALLVDPQLDGARLRAHALATRAFTVSSSIPREYLAASHPDLPVAYSENFTAAMAAFSSGLDKRDAALMAQGVERYNAFLRWMQSKRREDFKPLR